MNELLRPNGPDATERGLSQRNAIGGEIERTAEANTAQLEAQAKALIQSRLFMAFQNRRSWDQVEQRLRSECKRPGFANAAWWILPYGNDPKKYPKGLSIRFAEAALRLAGNIDVQIQTVYDDAWKRIVRVTVLDLEGNYSVSTEATVEKFVERRDARGREVLSVRQNSTGEVTYLVGGTEQEIALKQGSAVSKAIRTNGLRLIPGDILDECKAIIEDTRAKGAQAEDPEAGRKQILDAFADIGVLPEDLAKYLGHDTNIFQPAKREQLRGIYQAIRDGHATWKDVLEAKFGPEEGEPESEATRKLKEKLSRKPTTNPTTATGSADAHQTQGHATPSAGAPTQDKPTSPVEQGGVSAGKQSEPPAQQKGGAPHTSSSEPTEAEGRAEGGPSKRPSKSVIYFEGTDWPDQAPTDRPFSWNGQMYEWNENAGNFRKVDDSLFAGQQTTEPPRDPGEERGKGKRR